MSMLKYKNIKFSITSSGSICWTRDWNNVELMKAAGLIADLSEYFTDEELDAPGHMYQDCGPFIKSYVLENVRLQEALLAKIDEARFALQDTREAKRANFVDERRLRALLVSAIRATIKGKREELRCAENMFGVSVVSPDEIRREREDLERRQREWACKPLHRDDSAEIMAGFGEGLEARTGEINLPADRWS